MLAVRERVGRRDSCSSVTYTGQQNNSSHVCVNNTSPKEDKQNMSANTTKDPEAIKSRVPTEKELESRREHA